MMPTRNLWISPLDEVLCHLEVPGLTPDDIDIQVQDNMLVVSGEKKAATEQSRPRSRASDAFSIIVMHERFGALLEYVSASRPG